LRRPQVQRGRHRRRDRLALHPLRGPGYRDWKIETSGPLTGKGTGSIAPDLKGTWWVAEDDPEGDVHVTYSVNLSLTMKPRQNPDAVDGVR
jgi:hypothetical protein